MLKIVQHLERFKSLMDIFISQKGVSGKVLWFSLLPCKTTATITWSHSKMFTASFVRCSEMTSQSHCRWDEHHLWSLQQFSDHSPPNLSLPTLTDVYRAEAWWAGRMCAISSKTQIIELGPVNTQPGFVEEGEKNTLRWTLKETDGNSICSCAWDIWRSTARAGDSKPILFFQDNPYTHLLSFSCLITNGAVAQGNTNGRWTEHTVRLSLRLICGLVLLGGR